MKASFLSDVELKFLEEKFGWAIRYDSDSLSFRTSFLAWTELLVLHLSTGGAKRTKDKRAIAPLKP
jgi:hypothetical protein